MYFKLLYQALPIEVIIKQNQKLQKYLGSFYLLDLDHKY